MTMHISVDKKQALFDAQVLANGNFYDDPEEQDPILEEVATHPEDGEEDVATLRLIMGGEFIVAEVPPCEGEPNWDYADAIKRAGYHIMGLLQENEMLLAAQGKDVAEQRVQLLVTLKELRDEHERLLTSVFEALSDPLGAECRRHLRDPDRLLGRVHAVITACEGKDHGHVPA